MLLKNSYLYVAFIFMFLTTSDVQSGQKVVSYCGSNSIYALLRLHGEKVSLSDIAETEIVKKKNKTLSFLDLKVILKKYNYNYECVKVDIEWLKLLKHPFIVQVNTKQTGDHFLTCWSSKGGVDIIDYPSAGFVQWERLEDFYTGYALIDANFEKYEIDENRPSHPIEKPNYEDARFHWLGGNSLNIGNVMNNEIIKDKYVFEFSNTGSKTLEVYDLKSSCSCLKANLEKKKLKPGETSKIEINIDIDSMGSFNAYCYFKTNDPLMLIGKASVAGNIISPIQISAIPRNCNFGKISQCKQRPYRKEIMIQNVVRESQKPVEIISVSSRLNCLKTQVDDQEKEELGGEVQLYKNNLVVELLADLPPGNYQDQIFLTYEGGRLTIPVDFTITPFVNASPSVCVFYLSSDDVSKKILLKTDNNSNFTVETVHTNASWLEIHGLDELSGKSSSHEFSLEIIEKRAGFLKSDVKFSGIVEGKDWSVIIPVLHIGDTSTLRLSSPGKTGENRGQLPI